MFNDVKKTVVLMVISVALCVALAVFTNLWGLLLMLPGSWFLGHMRSTRDARLSAAIKSSGINYKSELSGKTDMDRVTDLKLTMRNHLIKVEGLSEKLADSLVFFRSRLMWGSDQWDASVRSVKSLKEQGYSDTDIAVFFRLNEEGKPTATKMELMKEALGLGVDLDSIRFILSKDGYSIKDLECAVEYHSVYKMGWESSVLKSATIPGGLKGA